MTCQKSQSFPGADHVFFGENPKWPPEAINVYEEFNINSFVTRLFHLIFFHLIFFLSFKASLVFCLRKSKMAA